jgi:hypothetical protein
MRGWMEESAQPPQKPIKTSGPAHFTRCSLQQQHHQGGRRDAPPVPAPPPLRNLHLPPQLPLPLAAARSGPGPKVLLPPPMPKKVPFTVSAHGRSWSDPYHWMRDTSDPDLAALLAAENAYADAFVGSAGGGGLRARLAAEMRVRLPPSVVTPPQPWGPWFVSRCLI